MVKYIYIYIYTYIYIYIYTYETSLWLIRRFQGEKRRGLANPQPTQVKQSLSLFSLL